MTRLATLLLTAALGFTSPALAHDGENHAQSGGQPTWAPAAAMPAAAPFGLDIGGPFDLLDHTGQNFTEADLHGSYSLVFFGYANCQGMCPLGLRRMTQAVKLLGSDGKNVRPVLITVDPQETPEILAALVAELDPRLIALTGTAEQLKAAAAAYKVESSRVGTALDGTQVFQHGSYIYVMNPEGELLSVLPPVLPADALAAVLRRHLQKQAAPDG